MLVVIVINGMLFQYLCSLILTTSLLANLAPAQEAKSKSTMQTFHIEATINAPVKTCWEAWTDVKVASQWLGTTHVGAKVGEDYRITQLIPYLSGRHKILEMVENKTLKLQFFIDGWPAELAVQFSEVTVDEKVATKLVIDFSVDSKGADKSVEFLRPAWAGFNFIRGSWNNALSKLRCLLEDKEVGVVMSVQNNDHVINLYIDIKSTPEKLYNSLIDVDEMMKWSGDDFVLKSGEIDPKVGGIYSYGWYPKGTLEKDMHDGPSKILKLEKNKLLVHNWHGGQKMAEITYHLEDKGKGITRLTFKHSPLLGHTSGNTWSYRNGWSEGLYGLKWYAERGELGRKWMTSK